MNAIGVLITTAWRADRRLTLAVAADHLFSTENAYEWSVHTDDDLANLATRVADRTETILELLLTPGDLLEQRSHLGELMLRNRRRRLLLQPLAPRPTRRRTEGRTFAMHAVRMRTMLAHERVGDHHHAVPPGGVLLRKRSSAERGLNAEDLEEVRAAQVLVAAFVRRVDAVHVDRDVGLHRADVLAVVLDGAAP